jgi:hypothetical protein
MKKFYAPSPLDAMVLRTENGKTKARKLSKATSQTLIVYENEQRKLLFVVFLSAVFDF